MGKNIITQYSFVLLKIKARCSEMFMITTKDFFFSFYCFIWKEKNILGCKFLEHEVIQDKVECYLRTESKTLIKFLSYSEIDNFEWNKL